MNRPDKTPASLGVCIVSWNCADLMEACLTSVAAEFGSVPNCRVVVVDNASSDATADRVQELIASHGWSSQMELLRAPSNDGFAAGNNAAMRALRHSGFDGEFILFLNPDTVVRPGAFKLLLDFMADQPDVGIAGGRSEDPDTKPQACCFRFPSISREVAATMRLHVADRMLAPWLKLIDTPSAPLEVDWVSGAFMLVRREVFAQIGLMDEGYFLYFEETDFTIRARRAGWRCWHVPQSRIVHLVGQSSGVTVRGGRPRRRPAYWFESRRRYFILNHGRPYAILVDLAVAAGYCIARPIRRLTRHWYDDPPNFLIDLLKHGALFNGRRTLKPRRSAF